MSSQASSWVLEDALALYQREFLASRNLAPLTRQAYLADLEDLYEFLRERSGLADVAHVRREHLEGFLSDLDQRNLSGNYRRRKIAAIRSFFGFLEERGLVLKSPAGKLIPRSGSTTSPGF